jgi:hypothetical protein
MINFSDETKVFFGHLHSRIQASSFHAGVSDISKISLRTAISFTKKNKDKKRPAKEEMCVADTPTLELKVAHFGTKGRKYSGLIQSSFSLGRG